MLSPISYKRCYAEFYVGKIPRIRIVCSPLQRSRRGFKMVLITEPSEHLCRRYIRSIECPYSWQATCVVSARQPVKTFVSADHCPGRCMAGINQSFDKNTIHAKLAACFNCVGYKKFIAFIKRINCILLMCILTVLCMARPTAKFYVQGPITYCLLLQQYLKLTESYKKILCAASAMTQRNNYQPLSQLSIGFFLTQLYRHAQALQSVHRRLYLYLSNRNFV